jgi:hypothetical protein
MKTASSDVINVISATMMKSAPLSDVSVSTPSVSCYNQDNRMHRHEIAARPVRDTTR